MNHWLLVDGEVWENSSPVCFALLGARRTEGGRNSELLRWRRGCKNEAPADDLTAASSNIWADKDSTSGPEGKNRLLTGWWCQEEYLSTSCGQLTFVTRQCNGASLMGDDGDVTDMNVSFTHRAK